MRHTLKSALGWMMAIAFSVAGTVSGAPLKRELPQPLPGHPGNVFVQGEEVVFALPANQTSGWQLLDYDEKVLMETVAVAGGRVSLGKLPPGFYRLKRAGEGNWISLAVLPRLQAPTPTTSPVALDVAMAWFYSKDKMDAAANLCALAGVNWVRDRLNWSQMEPQRGRFSGTNQYDASALAQSRAGLQVLQVNHMSPSWANSTSKRFPPDLRDAYRFYREMAKRWRGQVPAFEPWNEADIPMFGGHIGSEMASLQKASYLGLKAGNPDVIAGLNVFATHRPSQLEDLHANAAWPYFDTFNLHHYEGFDRLPRLYADFRAVSAGRPLWVSECALPVKWAGDEKLKEPTDADLRAQAERVAKTFALSVHEGSRATFYFLLPHYVEGQTQFGILRPDLTPRPAFVALAAVGRLMADAQPLGRWNLASNQHACAFRTLSDGKSRELIVAWQDRDESMVSLPVVPEAAYDLLGRARPGSKEIKLSVSPQFVLLPAGAARRFSLTPPPEPPAVLPGQPSPIVLQASMPEEKTVLNQSAYRVSGDAAETIPVWIYNFDTRAAKGRLQVHASEAWTAKLPATVELEPMERKELALVVEARGGAARSIGIVRIDGDFGSLGHPLLSLRLTGGGKKGAPLSGAMEASRWAVAVSGGGKASASVKGENLLIESEPGGSDKWIYPTLNLLPGERPTAGTVGLVASVTLLEGSGQFRMIFEEENGSAYVAEFASPPRRGQTSEATAFFEGATHGGGWSKPDPNGRLDAEQIRVVKIGCNTSANRVVFQFKGLRWIQ